ncbi:MAG: hypothetical protein ABIN57_06810 [Chitinophagaceae bacterium]
MKSDLLPLLFKIKDADTIQTYHYFPEIIKAGNYEIDKEDADFLLAEGYIKETKVDCFGKWLQLTTKAKELLRVKD